MSLAPIVLFTYKRLDTLKNTVSALKMNTLASESELYIFSDGAKNENDREYVESVRSFLSTIEGFKSVKIKLSTQNNGLANSIIKGVSEIFKEYDKVIVLEDDLYTTSNFLEFMNQSLDIYQSENKVFSISGFSFNFNRDTKSTYDSYFLNRGWSWGWATWRNRWVDIDWKMIDYDSFISNSIEKRKFSLLGSDVLKMLIKQKEGKVDSWAIRWFYHQFKVQGITLYPLYAKVSNEGFDQFATHTKGNKSRYIPSIDYLGNSNFTFPTEINITKFYQKQFQDRMSMTQRIISKIKTVLRIKN